MDEIRRQMTMVAFLQAQNCSNYPASWRHPETQNNFLDAAFYQRIGQVLEEGKFHAAFFDDRLAMPDAYGNDYEAAVRHGIRSVKLDPVTVMTMMGAATRNLGLGATYSTTYYEPFHVARLFATLDHMLAGRVAWNVVTSLNDSEAANFGQDQHLGHDERYDRADEFMQVVFGLWDGWGGDAIVLDKERGIFADPSKVDRLDYRGEWFRCRGPFTVPRTPQGRPMILQAGQSGRGRDFAARWADIIFALYPNVDVGKRMYGQFKDVVAKVGRDPQEVSVLPATYVVVGESRQMAQEKNEMIDRLALPIDALSLLSETLNFDFSKKQPEEEFTDAEMASIGGLQAIRDRVVQNSGKARPTLNDFVQMSARATIRELNCFTGTPKDIADEMEAWFTGGACDGFVLAATHLPGTYEEFVRLVVPELQRRGIYREQYAGTTLRENLGSPMPVRGDWKRRL